MFNFLAAALMTYLLVNVLIAPGQQIPESAVLPQSAWLPQMHEIMGALGIEVARSPLNLSFLFALICCLLFWLFVWQTRYGYALRVVGQNETAAVYGGISPARQIMLAMTISGALAGFVALNMILGAQHRLTLDFTGGFGFVGIAVALMGRNHPVGIVMAALLFGALYQGGSEIAFDIPEITREMVIVIQGLVILFCGALENMFKPQIVALFRWRAVAVEAA
jgi:simple sugar transport system permease protein